MIVSHCISATSGYLLTYSQSCNQPSEINYWFMSTSSTFFTFRNNSLTEIFTFMGTCSCLLRDLYVITGSWRCTLHLCNTCISSHLSPRTYSIFWSRKSNLGITSRPLSVCFLRLRKLYLPDGTKPPLPAPLWRM